VLKPGGLMLVSTFGPDTLYELRESFAHADATPHVSPFADHRAVRRCAGARRLPQSGARSRPARNPIRRPARVDARVACDRRHQRAAIASPHADGRARFAAAARAYEGFRAQDGTLPATWETITAMAWAPEPGAPIREGGFEVTTVPVAAIPIRRKPRL
jgi:malonyl-CoA O-methyltransferase